MTGGWKQKSGWIQIFPASCVPFTFPFLSQSAVCLIVSRVRAYLTTDQQIKTQKSNPTNQKSKIKKSKNQNSTNQITKNQQIKNQKTKNQIRNQCETGCGTYKSVTYYY